jgi:predicted metal-dependent hydrolase
MKKMVISDIHIDVVKKDIKNMHLAVYPPQGKVRLATPMNVSDETIKLFTISKLNWIKKNQRKFIDQNREASRKFVNGESHYFFGKRYLLKVVEEDRPAKVSIKGKRQIVLHVRPGATIQQRQEIVHEWYRTELKNILPKLISKWEKKMDISVHSWGVKQMKTKWGTCSIEAKRIWLNLELAKKPVRCLEYIVVHELVHLFERKHNDEFLELMHRFMPQWKTYRDELNRMPISHVSWDY